MDIEIRHSPAYSVAYCRMAVGEVVRAERGAMIAMSGGMKVTVDTGPGGIARGLMRKALVGEGLFMTRFESQAHGAWVSVASKYPGDMVVVPVGGTAGAGIVAEAGSLVAMTEGVSADPRWAGLRMIAMREGATMIRVAGEGQVLLAAYGGIEAFDIQDGESLVFDSGHIVAFTEGMPVRVGPLTNVLTSALSGEGLVAEISGPGRVWTQTRAVIEAGAWLLPDKRARQRD